MYHLKGDLQNGSFVTKEDVCRRMVSSTETAEIIEQLPDTARIERVNGAIYVYNL